MSVGFIVFASLADAIAALILFAIMVDIHRAANASRYIADVKRDELKAGEEYADARERENARDWRQRR